jgi:hypothetical protein
MMSTGFRKRSVWLLRLGLAAALCIPIGAEGQSQLRLQAAGTSVFDGDYHALIGVDIGVDIGGGDCQPGGPVCSVPNWTFLLAGYVGAGSAGLTGYGHIGLERKLSDQLSLGVVGFGFADPGQGGGALRFDAIDVVALKVGYGWGEDDGVLLAAELAFEFIRDLFR